MASQSYGAMDDVYEVNDPVTKRELKEMYRTQQSGEMFVQATIVLCSVCCFLWILPLFFGPWHAVAIDLGGLGRQFEFEADLFDVKINFDCIELPQVPKFLNIFSAICNIMDLLDLTGKKTVRDTMNQSCLVSDALPFLNGDPAMCHFFMNYFLLTYAVFFSSLIAVILHLIAMILIGVYWWALPLKRLREWGGNLLVAAPMLPLIVAFALWWFILVMQDSFNASFQKTLKSIPGLGVALTSLGGNFTPGYAKRLPFCWWIFCFNIALSLVAAVVWMGWSSVHMREELVEDIRANEKEQAAQQTADAIASVKSAGDYQGGGYPGSYPGQQSSGDYSEGLPNPQYQQQYAGGLGQRY